jgi:HEAT repeat protein
MADRFICERCRRPLPARRRQAGTPPRCPKCKGEVPAPASGGLSARRRALILAAGVALALLIVAGSLTVALAWPRPQPKEPAPEPEVADANPPAPAAADDEEEERPRTAALMLAVSSAAVSEAEGAPSDAPTGAEEPAAPPPRPAPAPAPAAAAPKRGPVALDTLTQEQLRGQLADAMEVGLTPAELPPLVKSWASNFALDLQMHGDLSFGPAVVLRARPDFAALPIRYGRANRISGKAAMELQRLSRRLHGLLDLAAPTDADGHRADPAVLRQVMLSERLGRKPLWLRPEAVPTLMQLLSHEDEPVRALLVELLADIDGKPATVALAKRAVFELSADVRGKAVEALRRRPPADARLVFLDALRYPWAPPAQHAAEALVALNDRDSVPSLVALLKEPTPLAPFRVNKDRWAMREVVALRHVNNCLACHPPAGGADEPVPGVIPNLTMSRKIVGQLPSAGGGSGGGGGWGGGSSGSGRNRVNLPVVVRADIAFLRQDFSVQHPVPGQPRAVPLRFDYLVRTRLLTTKQAKALRRQTDDLTTYPQREAVLHALRELTGRDAGPTTAAWEALYPGANLEARTGRLILELLAAAPEQRDAVIARYRDRQGAAYTDALAGSVARLPAEAQKTARAALAERLTRMMPKTLRQKLADDDAEIRRAAVEACQRLGEKQFVPDLVGLLDDDEPGVARAAGQALKALTGQEFTTAKEWQEWWEKQGAE